MEGIISFGNKKNYEDFKKQIPSPVLPLFDSIREFCFSLGDKMIEDVRMHRVVFCKSMTFRWFADVEPEREGVIIKIQKSRKDPIQIIHVKILSALTFLHCLDSDLYINLIHKYDIVCHDKRYVKACLGLLLQLHSSYDKKTFQ